MTNWFEARLPAPIMWESNVNFWASALIDHYHDASGGYIYPVGLESYSLRHTLTGVLLDSVLVLIDHKRDCALLSVFPAFLGITSGAPLYSGDFGDPDKREPANEAEIALAKELNLDRLRLRGPDDMPWTVYAKEVPAGARFFQADGRSLSAVGEAYVREFVRRVLHAACQWILVSEVASSRLDSLKIEVFVTSIATPTQTR